ncbi:MAG: PAS domain-containing protein [Ectothiorhodospiraceae bacterium]|nr:PAS domain-containing protein [Ectothiorhodospiraceae bacterium]
MNIRCENEDENDHGKGAHDDELTLVAIGASAGGLEALRELIGSLEPKTRLAFVVAQHLSPKHNSMLTELLARGTTMPVSEVTHGVKPKPGAIYITPANKDIEFREGRLALSDPPERTVPKPSVDLLFCSLAEELGERTIAVVLSGTGSDGSQGLRRVKVAGGITFAQKPPTAKYDGMPQSAIATGCVDFMLPPADIGRELSRFTALFQELQRNAEETPDTPVYQRIASQVLHHNGLDLDAYKPSTVRRRLRRRMAANDINSLEDYAEHLTRNQEEVDSLAREILISVTSFFRDRDAFKALDAPLQKLLDRKSDGDHVRIWIPGCATGEEAYSLAVQMLELARQGHKDVHIQLFATDLDSRALGVARRGIYDEVSLSDMAPELRDRYFVRQGAQFRVSKQLRDMLVFARQNLLKDPPFLRLDMVSCRNLLIYFSNDTQRRLFELFHYALRPNGLLFLGKSEAVSRHEHLFATVDSHWKIFRRRSNQGKDLRPARHRRTVTGEPKTATPAVDIKPRRTPYERMVQTAMRQFTPPSLLVDESLNIQHMTGDLGRFLTFPDGRPDFSLRNLVRREMRIDLAALLARARKQAGSVSSRLIGLSAEHRAVRVHIHPVSAEEDEAPLFMISFEEASQETTSAWREAGTHDKESGYNERVRELEDELQATREHLQTVIEELETTNEELQSSNEELQSSNEELHSSNEELETTNEEMQSSNEELTTVNEELNSKTRELNEAYSDLENVMASLADGLIVVDERMRVKFYNPACERVFALGPENFGSMITDVDRHIEVPRFQQRLKKVIETGAATEIHISQRIAVSDEDEPASAPIRQMHHYLMRMRPYLDPQRHVRGALISFYDTTRIKHAERMARESEARLHAILARSPVLTMLKDRDGRYTYANTAAGNLGRAMGAASLVGRLDADLLPWDEAEQMRQLDERAFREQRNVESEETVSLAGEPRRLIMERFPLFDEDGQLYGLCIKALDITERQRTDEQVRLQSKALDAATTGILISDATEPDLPIVYTNPAFTRISGHGADEVRGRNCRFLQGSETAPESLERIRQALREQRAVSVLLLNYRKDGKPFWNELSIFPIFDDTDALTHFVGIQEDVTQRVEVERALRANEQRLRNAQTFAGVVHFEWNSTEPRHVAGGESLGALLGLNGADRIRSRHLLRHLSRLDRSALLRAFSRCIRLSKELHLEFRIRDRNGNERWLLVRAAAIHGRGTPAVRVLGLVQDITARKQVELALVSARLEAEAANRAKSEFLSHMSHELRTPLNAVLGFAQLLDGDRTHPLHDKHKVQVHHILTAGWHLLELISEVLELARVEAGEVQIRHMSIEPLEFLDDCLSTVSPMAAEHGVRLETDIQGTRPLYLDPTRVRQVVLNLLTNAIKYNREGGLVTLAMHQDKKYCTLSVRDNGLGIPENRMDELFQAFNRLGHEGGAIQGSGIGLVVAKRMVELMGGTIQVRSTEGSGSTFTVRFPMNAGSAFLHDTGTEMRGRHDARLEAPPDTTDQPCRILYIEDNESNRLLARDVLQQRMHCELMETPDAETGLALAQTEQPDIVLMDLHLPGMNGFEAFSLLRSDSRTSHIPVIAISADAAGETTQRIRDAGFDSHLDKPLSVTALIEAINNARSPRGGAVHTGGRD